MFHKPGTQDNRILNLRQKKIYKFLDSNRTGVLATVGSDGEPHGAVIYHTVDHDFNVSFLTKTGTRKYDNLRHNQHTVLVVYDPVTQTVVQVIGTVIEITDGYEINGVAAAVFMTSLKTSDGGIPPIAKLNADEYAAFRIVPTQIRMASYLRPDSNDYTKIFESIESFELHSEV